MSKLTGCEFWQETLRSARHVVAPMVDQSELAWRILSRRHGAHLAYTPMFHSKVFCASAVYRRRSLETLLEEDRPLIVQFCGNDPEVLLQAALMVQDKCDAVDINLGCPQTIAKRGHYGAFLMEEWELIGKIVKTLHEHLSVPVTCKVRVFPDPEKTVSYAKMLEAAGCQLLTVHGRLREQKGPLTGLADWEQIKRVKESVSIPVFANGNIVRFEDIQRCLDYTGCQGVMSAEGNLYNPAIFSGPTLPRIADLVREYLEICREYPPPDDAFVRGHLFKLFRPAIHLFPDQRKTLGCAKDMEEVRGVAEELCILLSEMEAKAGKDLPDAEQVWLCLPYYRYVKSIEKFASDDNKRVEQATKKIKVEA